MTTMHVRRRPKKPLAKQAQAQTDAQQLKAFAWRHRDDLKPLALAVLVFLGALLVQPVPGAPLLLVLTGVAAAAVLYAAPWSAKERGWALGQWVRGRRARMAWEEKERVYAGGLALGAGIWMAWFVQGGLRPLLVFPFLVALAGIPWWRHRTPRASVPVTIANELQGAERRRAEAEARHIIDGWESLARRGRIPGARLLALAWDQYSKSAVVELRHGQNRRSLNYSTVANALESALDAPMGSLRVEDPGEVADAQRTARLAKLRFLINDPNAEPLGVPTDAYDAPTISLGRFETAEPVIMDEEVHTGVFGMSGSGKSGMVNTIIRRLRWRRSVCLIGFDLKPGAPELRPWSKVWYVLADTPDKARRAMKALIDALEARGEMMSERGWRKWKATPAEPDIYVIIDEAQELRDHKLMGDMERLAGLMRAYGGRFLVATQHPKDTNLPTTIYNAIRQVVGMKVSDKADRVVFGENATRDGWTPSKLPDDGGRFFIRSPRYRHPVPARGFWMEDQDVERENELGPEAVRLDARTAIGFIRAGLVSYGEDEIQATASEESDIVEAELVEDRPQDTVLDAIRDGVGTPRAIAKATGIPERTVKLYIAQLAREGRIHQSAPRRPWTSLD